MSVRVQLIYKRTLRLRYYYALLTITIIAAVPGGVPELRVTGQNLFTATGDTPKHRAGARCRPESHRLTDCTLEFRGNRPESAKMIGRWNSGVWAAQNSLTVLSDPLRRPV